MTPAAKKKRLPRCSKCGKVPWSVLEITEATTEFAFDKRGICSTGDHNFYFSADCKVYIVCKCGHYWKSRKTIAEIREDYGEWSE